MTERYRVIFKIKNEINITCKHHVYFLLYSQVIIGAPTLQQRKSILSVLCATVPVCPSVDMTELAQRTSGYVGADLSALCREAAMNAIRENSKVNLATSSGKAPYIKILILFYFVKWSVI